MVRATSGDTPSTLSLPAARGSHSSYNGRLHLLYPNRKGRAFLFSSESPAGHEAPAPPRSKPSEDTSPSSTQQVLGVEARERETLNVQGPEQIVS